MGIATIIAVIAGPILAVLVTRYVDERRIKQTRRMNVFRTLMRTRKMRLSADHVGAINLVEIEFQGEQQVLVRWKEYWNHLAQGAVPNPTEAQNKEFNRTQRW